MLVFASTFDNISNDFPLHPALFHSSLRRRNTSAAWTTAGGRVHGGRLPGAARRKGAGHHGRGARSAESRALSLEEAARARNLLLAKEGYYEVRRPSGRHELVAVNADRHESDLDVFPETLTLWQNTGQAVAAGEQAENGERRVPIWPYVLAIALALAIAESLVGNRHLALDKESS